MKARMIWCNMKKIYVLNSNNYEMHIVPCYGMNCIKAICTKPNADILKTPHDVDMLGSDDAFLFGMPILFFPNRISNGRFEFEGREYKFPVNEVKLNNFCHGTLHKLPFEVIEYDDEHIKGVFIATGDYPYLTFPHSFEFYVEYCIKLDGIHQIVSIKNTSEKNMPVALGFHTTFNLSDKNMIKISVAKEIERSVATFLPTGKIYDVFELKEALNKGVFKLNGRSVSNLFELSGRKIQILDEETKTRITYIFDEKYKYCMLYSSNGKDHICIEPQTWLTNCPNLRLDRKECGFDYIEPNEIKVYTSVLRAE